MSTSLPLPSVPLSPSASPSVSPIAGNVLPIQRAEELLATLPGVISARIIAAPNGAVQEIHVLTTTEVLPKQTVRNIESALIAHLGMRVSHKIISVATSTDDSQRVTQGLHATASSAHQHPAVSTQYQAVSPQPSAAAPVSAHSLPHPQHQAPTHAQPASAAEPSRAPFVASDFSKSASVGAESPGRRIYFEDVEVRRSRTRGVTCRVTLRKGSEVFIGEAEGLENERFRLELSARAALAAIRSAEGEARIIGLEGSRIIDAFDRQWVFVGVATRQGRENGVTTGSAEIRESLETSSVLAVLDATNRWLDYTK